MAEIPRMIGGAMNRRRMLIAAGTIALAAAGSLAAWSWGLFSRGDGRVTLKSRVLKYNRSLIYMRTRPSQEESDAYVTRMLSEYFHVGMPYDEVVSVLIENDLGVDESSENMRDYRVISPPSYFNRSIVSRVGLPARGLFVTFTYRLIFRFKNDYLDEFKAVFAGSGL